MRQVVPQETHRVGEGFAFAYPIADDGQDARRNAWRWS